MNKQLMKLGTNKIKFLIYGIISFFLLITIIIMINVRHNRHEIDNGYMILETSSMSPELN